MYIELLIKLKNAQAAKHMVVKHRFTKMDNSVAELLHARGYLKHLEVKGRSYKRVMEMELNPERPIQGLKLLSKPSRKLYGGYTEFHRVRGGYGMLAVSTPKGVMAGDKARKEKVGGQLLFEIW